MDTTTNTTTDNGYKNITWDEFESKYKPLKNHFVTSAPVNDWMYETYGTELEYVEKVLNEKGENYIWTFLDGEDKLNQLISNGFHHINRIGYIITEIPWEGSRGNIDVFDEDDYVKNTDPVKEKILEALGDYEGTDFIVTTELLAFIEGLNVKDDTTISIVWGVDDVIGRVHEMEDIMLTEDQAKEILVQMKDNHDCNNGITWDTIDIYARELLNKG